MSKGASLDNNDLRIYVSLSNTIYPELHTELHGSPCFNFPFHLLHLPTCLSVAITDIVSIDNALVSPPTPPTPPTPCYSTLEQISSCSRLKSRCSAHLPSPLLIAFPFSVSRGRDGRGSRGGSRGGSSDRGGRIDSSGRGVFPLKWPPGLMTKRRSKDPPFSCLLPFRYFACYSFSTSSHSSPIFHGGGAHSLLLLIVELLLIANLCLYKFFDFFELFLRHHLAVIKHLFTVYYRFCNRKGGNQSFLFFRLRVIQLFS